MPTDILSEILACPRCDRTPLDRRQGPWHCEGCRVDFPIFAGIPWLFSEPQATLGEWRGKFHFALRKLESERDRLARALQSRDLLDVTERRLEMRLGAVEEHLAQLNSLLAPLKLESLIAEQATYLALRTRLPSDQGLTTYYNNVHRDWCWGDEENQASMDLVWEAAGGELAGRVLILGAGAGRLAYDLHMRSTAEATIVLDFNPLLLLLAQKITMGESVELYEFPIAPRALEDQAVQRTLAAEQPARAGLHYVLADAQRPPFAPGSFDAVVTPWLVDILPGRFEELCARINGLLGEHGRWINFGSVSFANPDPALCYSLEEAVEIVAAQGFSAPAVSEGNIPYMCSPASRHGRREKVVAWSAVKTAKAKKQRRHEALPDWLVRGKDPVPATQSFRMQAMSTRIHAFIMSLIDGRRSIQDMAGVLAEQKLMTREEAEPAVRAFLIKMYEDSRRT